MKLKRIIAGITAFSIVGSTMLAMPISAKTTTKAENVKIADVLDGAKMVAQVADNLTEARKAQLIDKFDTNGSKKLEIGEILAMAMRVARINEDDIVNDYGTADETTTTEETSETTIETTETTEETTTTTEIIEFNPVLEIEGKEYKDGDKFIAEADGIYTVNVTDAENEITFSLTGSQDEDGNALIEVYETRFKVKADGKLTVTVTTADGQEKTITLNVVIAKHLKDADLEKLNIKCIDGEEIYYSEKYKNFSNEIGFNEFNNEPIQDPETYWEDLYEYRCYCISASNDRLVTPIGGKIKIVGFAYNNRKDYDTTDEVKFISSNSNKVTIDENGVITGIEETDEPVEIIVIVNGQEFSKITVVVTNKKCAEIESSGEKYIHYSYYYAYTSSDNYYYGAEGKYVENLSSGEALSLKDLQNQVGAENVKSVSVKNLDGTKIELDKIEDVEGIVYYLDKTNSTVYYAIADKSGMGYFNIYSKDYTVYTRIKVLDMEQYKKYQEEQQTEETFSVEIYEQAIAFATKSGTYYRCENPIIYMTEGETFTLSDIAKVSGVDDPNIKVKNSQEGTSAQNLTYDPLTKTFKVLELTEENSDENNQEKITLTYETSDGKTREIEFYVNVVRPVFAGQLFTNKKDTGKIYCTPEQMSNILNMRKIVLDDGSYWWQDVSTYKYTFDNTKMLKKTSNMRNGDTLSLADNYTPKAGDTVTITATAENYYEKGCYNIFSPNVKVTYTIEVIEEYPQISQNPLKEAVFEYPADNKANQIITFENILNVKNIPDDWEIVPVVLDASGNVCYINYTNDEVTPTDMTVDARNIKVVKGTNGYYSISGIEVASAPKVDPDTYMNVEFFIFDKDGNIVTTTSATKLFIKGEKGMNDSFFMTIDGKTKEVKANETTDFGTIYIEEGKTIDYSTSGTYTGSLRASSNKDNVTVEEGKIKAKMLDKNTSQGNTEGKEVTFTYGEGSAQRKVKLNVVVVRTKLTANYQKAKEVDVKGGEFWKTDGNTLTAEFITEVDANGNVVKSQSVSVYTTQNNKATFVYPNNNKINVSCTIKEVGTIAENKKVDKNVAMIAIDKKVPEGLSLFMEKISTEVAFKLRENSSGQIVLDEIDTSKISGVGTASVLLTLKDSQGVIVAKQTLEVKFIETIFTIGINGNIINTYTEEADIPTVYVEEGGSINYALGCVDAGVDKSSEVKISKDKLTVNNRRIIAPELTSDCPEINEIVVFSYTTELGDILRRRVRIIVVKPLSIAPAYSENGYINVTGDTYYTADISKKKAIPAFATKVDKNGKPVLTEGLIKDGFTAGSTSGDTTTYRLCGINIDVTNKKQDPATFLAVVNDGAKNCTFLDKATTSLTFDSPYADFKNLSAGWRVNGAVESSTSYNKNSSVTSDWKCGSLANNKVEFVRTQSNEFDMASINLKLTLTDKNGNLVATNSSSYLAYHDVENNIALTNTENEENKKFTYKIQESITDMGWENAGVKVPKGETGYKVEKDDSTTGLFTITLDEPISTSKKVKVNLVNSYQGNNITKEIEVELNPVTGDITPTPAENHQNKEFTYNVSAPDGWIINSASSNDCTATMMENGQLKLAFANPITANTDAKVEFTLKNGDLTYKKTVNVTATLYSVIIEDEKVTFTQTKNVNNTMFEYKVTNTQENITIESVTSNNGNYTATLNEAKNILTVNVSGIVENSITLTFGFKDSTTDLTTSKEIIVSVSRMEFPEIQLEKSTGTEPEVTNNTVKYNIINDLTGWTLKVTDDGVTMDFTNGTITVPKEMINGNLKYTLEKTENGITYTSREKTLNLTGCAYTNE